MLVYTIFFNSLELIFIFFSKSFLFITIILSLSFVFSNISSSSFVRLSLLFNTTITKSASSIIDRLFSTPNFSTISSVERIPAVSIIFNKIPSKYISPSTMSRVVPAISVTIAFSCSSNLFKMLLFPTLGRPIITVFIPSLIKVEFLDSLITFFKSSFITFNSFSIFSFVTTSIS